MSWRDEEWNRISALAGVTPEGHVAPPPDLVALGPFGGVMKVPTVSCERCDRPTRMLGTKRCDRCWELENRVRADPDLAKAILAEMEE